MDDSRKEILAELDNEWHTLKYGNPIPSLYPQTGTETVKVRGKSVVKGDHTITSYEVVMTEAGEVVGRYRVIAEEVLGDYTSGYAAGEEAETEEQSGYE